MNSRTGVVLGASGLVGGFCLKALVDDPDYTRVLTFGRKELPAQMTRAKVTQRVADLGTLNAGDFRGAQDVFSALGTTIRKAGSQAAFRHVDFELPLRAAQEAVKAGVEQFIVVSSVGADPASRNFYLRTKGELEQELARLPFRAVHILRPSLLIGKRPEFRLGESMAIKIAPLLDLFTLGSLRHYHSIRAEIVGRAMLAAARLGTVGTHIYEFDEILRVGRTPAP
ncbi:MAG TPA: NAD(P)H-binding protein [Candidatus Angelobacter sp.]|nr:NAD(P)H-binding protein [Candidatus Angelobacter sp.]